MSSGRFPRRARLTRPEEFKRVFSKPVRAGDGAFLVLGRPNNRGRARLGLAISVRQSGGAVRRNRLKRIVRESFRRHQAELTGLDLVVIARPDARRLADTELQARLEQHWKRVISRCARSSSV